MYLWTDSYDVGSQAKYSESLCGSPVGEAKFSSHIDAILKPEQVINYKDYTLTLEFGTTLSTDPSYSSYGISSLRVLLR